VVVADPFMAVAAMLVEFPVAAELNISEVWVVMKVEAAAEVISAVAAVLTQVEVSKDKFLTITVI
jgi:hypothetical protein